MFRRLSVLRLFFVIFALSSLTCVLGFSGAGSSDGDTSRGKFFRGHGSGGDTKGFRSLGGVSDSQSFMRRSSGQSFGQPSSISSVRLDPFDPYVARSEGVDYVRIDRRQFGRPDQLSKSGRFGPESRYRQRQRGYRLPSLENRFNGKVNRSVDFQNDPGVSIRSLPPITDDLTWRIKLMARRERMIEEGIIPESEVYKRQEQATLQRINSDVNYINKSVSETVQREKKITELLAPSESDQIDSPLSPDELRQKITEMLDKEMFDKKHVDGLDDLKKDFDDADPANVPKPKRSKVSGDEGHEDGEKSNGAEGADVTGYIGGSVQGDKYVDIKSKRSLELLEKAKGFKKYAEEKYQAYIVNADKFLQNGEYHNAKDSYEIAGVWKSGDARAFAGKASAHLAVGEYMSSAQNFIRAMDSSGDYAGKKVDVATLIGNNELYKKRVSEIDDIYHSGRYYKVAFLLAYLSCQDGDFKLAKECIDSAELKLSGTVGWQSLSNVIEKRLTISNKSVD